MDIDKYTEIIAELGTGHEIRMTFRAQNLNRCFQGHVSMGLNFVPWMPLFVSCYSYTWIHCEQFHIWKQLDLDWGKTGEMLSQHYWLLNKVEHCKCFQSLFFNRECYSRLRNSLKPCINLEVSNKQHRQQILLNHKRDFNEVYKLHNKSE